MTEGFQASPWEEVFTAPSKCTAKSVKGQADTGLLSTGTGGLIMLCVLAYAVFEVDKRTRS